MNILKLPQATPFPNYQTTLLRALITHPHFLSPHTRKPHLPLSSNSPLSLCKPCSIELRHVKASRIESQSWSNEEEENLGADDLTPGGEVYKKTLRLVECSMFAALGGLAYILSSSLSIENYFGCFFALPIVFSSMRWGIAAGRKTMVRHLSSAAILKRYILEVFHVFLNNITVFPSRQVATATLLLVLSGPIKALTYLLLHGLLGLTMGSLWRYVGINLQAVSIICSRAFNIWAFYHYIAMPSFKKSKFIVQSSQEMILAMLAVALKEQPCWYEMCPDLMVVVSSAGMLGTAWGPSVFLCSCVRAMGATGYVLIYSFLIRENILALITINIHASLTYIITSLGLYTIPSMNTIYAIFGTLLLLNCGFFAFLLHLLYAVFFTRLGMRGSLRLPGWLEKAI
ncbi:hypothetical protein RJ639_036935 [Escallonia herrerae]|uniref:Uncharacterized protein n=1 Tax=Escallonia herrerae TaxID=1293975 RepID=A0AA89B9E9_9ASTE|nr:hypothetical protein RJ639_036935 [Escallonia herrerae]